MKSLASSKSTFGLKTPFLIGIATHNFESPIYRQMLHSAVSYLEAQGHGVIAQSTALTRASELDATHSLINCDCDGIILHADLLSNDDLEKQMDQYPQSVVMNRLVERYPNRSVYFDNIQGGALAASHLFEKGHRRVAMVTGPAHFVEAIDRSKGFVNKLAELSRYAEVCIELESDFTSKGGAAAMRELTLANKPISAVFFHNDEMAIGAIDWCRNNGIRIPKDMSIVGFDDLQICKHATPQLSSIKQPAQQIGKATAICLLNLLNESEMHEPMHASRCIEPQLANRASVATLTLDQESSNRCLMPLNKDEKLCIFWAAKGKTALQISLILGKSESMIVFHLRNASKTLNTVNRTHTVAEALRLGVISL